MHWNYENGVRVSRYDFRARNSSRLPEDLIDTTIGSGRWQILVTLMLSFTVLTHLLNAGNEAIVQPTGWWCRMPDFLHDWTDVQWIVYSHEKRPVNVAHRVWTPEMFTEGYYQGCRVFDIDYENLRGLSYSERPIIDTNRTVPCPYGVQYTKSPGQSLTEKFDRGCSNGTVLSHLWLSSISFGRVAGYIWFGALGDWIGRKFVIFIACGVTPITAIIVATSRDYVVFIVASILHGFFHGGFAISMVLIEEISTNSWRTGLLTISCGCFALGIGLTPAISSVFESYEQMIVFINVLCVVVFVSARFLPESPAWLFCIRDTNRLKSLILKAAEVNQRPVEANFRITYVSHANERYRLAERMPCVWSLVGQPGIAWEVVGIIYLTALFALIFGAAYYTLLATIAKSQLANTLLVAATTVGMLIGQLFILLMGHRRVLWISISLILASSLVLIIRLHDLKPSVTGPATTLVLFNVAVVSLGNGVLLNYNTRTFPTLLRGTLAGIFRATWTIFVWAGNHDLMHVPRIAIVLIMSCLVAALFTHNLQDLHHRELPDTILDSIHFSERPKPKRWEITEITNEDFSEEVRYFSMERPSWSLNSVGGPAAKTQNRRNNAGQIREVSPYGGVSIFQPEFVWQRDTVGRKRDRLWGEGRAT